MEASIDIGIKNERVAEFIRKEGVWDHYNRFYQPLTMEDPRVHLESRDRKLGILALEPYFPADFVSHATLGRRPHI